MCTYICVHFSMCTFIYNVHISICTSIFTHAVSPTLSTVTLIAYLKIIFYRILDEVPSAACVYMAQLFHRIYLHALSKNVCLHPRLHTSPFAILSYPLIFFTACLSQVFDCT